ncbi:MAG: LEM-3-like GIY-YIG domain-containing protein [Bacteroidia bacterium]
MFDEKTRQELKSYVYMLLDPQDEKPFYVGKGRANNRVFDHMACALTDTDASTLKYDRIREITNREQIVKHIIVRHGLTDDEAFQIEASLIDTLNYCGLGLSNLQGGHNSIEKGLMTSEEIIRLYYAQPLDEIGVDCVLININKTYKRGNGTNPIYQATKETWFKIGNMLDRKYVLSEYKGLIVEVFEVVGKWYEKQRPKNKTVGKDDKGKKIQIKIDSVGYGFDGSVAPEEIRTLYLNKSIAHKKIRGQANPVRLKL